MPLRLRLALLFATATAVVIALAGVAFVLQLRVSVDASLDPGLRARVAVVADEMGSEGDGPTFGAADGIVQVSAPDGSILGFSPEAGPTPLLDPSQRSQALAGETSFTATVNGDRSRVLATTIPASAGSGRLVVMVGTGTDVSDAAVERAGSALLIGGPPATLLAGLGHGCWQGPCSGRWNGCADRPRRSATRTSADGSRCPRPATRSPPSEPR